MSQFDFDESNDPWDTVGTININPNSEKKDDKLTPKVFNPNPKTQNNKKPKSAQSPFNIPKQQMKVEPESKPRTIVSNNSFNDDNLQELTGFVDLDSNKKTFDPNKEYNPDEELPLLEELGISTERIKEKVFSVLTFHKVNKQVLEDADMAGPFLIFIIFAISLILQKKTHFGYIYGITIFGGFLISSLMNLMSKKESIMLYNTISVLGYCMIPVVITSYVGVLFTLKQTIGLVLSLIAIIASSFTATNFFEEVLAMQKQKWLIFYPLFLFYTCFLILTLY